MSAAVKSFGAGVSTSFETLVDNAPIVVLGTTVGAGIGFLMGGAPMAWVAAKVSSLVLGILYGMDTARYVPQPDVFFHQNSYVLGNLSGAALIPYLFTQALCWLAI